MPKAAAFLNGFGIHKGMNIVGYKLTDVNISHNQIVRYREYSYPMKLTFVSQGSNNSGELLSEFSHLVREPKIIYSDYGNPYKCTFGVPMITYSYNNTVVISSEGHGTRVK